MLKSTQGNLKVEPHRSEKDAFTGWQAPEFEERPDKSIMNSNFLWLRNGSRIHCMYVSYMYFVKTTIESEKSLRYAAGSAS